MDFDLVLRDVRLADAKPDQPATDIGVKDGRIAAIAPQLGGSAKEQVQGGGRLVCSGFVETHIHLDKSCILARCDCETKRFPHLAMERVSAVKHTFTVEDVTERAAGTIEKCIGHGATRMRTHVEVDPKVGLRGLEGVKALIDRYRWAIDLEICVMPQEGLTQQSRHRRADGRRAQGRRHRGRRRAQLRHRPGRRRSAASSRWRANSTSTSTCISTAAPRPRSSTPCWSAISPRNTAGAAASPSATSPSSPRCASRTWTRWRSRLADSGVALTVLTATDLYLGGRHTDHNVPRNVVDLNRLTEHGVVCSVASNNILNPFTPFGDGQLLRQANMQAIVTQRGNDDEVRAHLGHDHEPGGDA